MDWLGEDLLLLALEAGRGTLERTFAIGYGLMGAELVQLAACGRIDIVDDQIVVTSPAPTGDAELDAALARIGEPPIPPWADEWVQRVRPRITGHYLERLIAAGVIGEQTRFRVARWPITGTARLAEARQRLDLIAGSAGPVDLSQTAYAALACAIGLGDLPRPGPPRRTGPVARDRHRAVDHQPRPGQRFRGRRGRRAGRQQRGGLCRPRGGNSGRDPRGSLRRGLRRGCCDQGGHCVQQPHRVTGQHGCAWPA